MAGQLSLFPKGQIPAEIPKLIAETERRLDQTMMMPAGGRRSFLPEITGIAADAV